MITSGKDKYSLIGLCALVLWAPLIEGGTTHPGWTVSRLIILGLVIIWIWRSAGGAEVEWPKHWVSGAILLFAILLFINTFRASYNYTALQWLMNYTAMAVALITAAALDERGKRWVYIFLVVSASFQAMCGIVEYLAHLEPRSNGTFFNPNYYGGYLAAMAIWVWGRITFQTVGASVRTPLPITLWLECLLLPLMIIGVIVSESRGAVLALFVGLAFISLVRWGMKVIPIMTVGALLVLLVPNPLVRRLETLGETDIYAWSRIDIWQSALAIIAKHPTGVGTGMYRFYSPRYAFPVEDAFARYGQVARMAHSAYLDVAAELGLLSAIILLGTGFYLLWKGITRARKSRDINAACAVGALTVIMTHAAVDSVQKSPPIAFTAALAGGFLLSGAIEGVKRYSLKVPERTRIYGILLATVLTWAIMSPYMGYEFLNRAGKRNELADPAGAAVWLDRALRINPGNAPLWAAWGSMEAARWKAGEGEEHFTEALDAYQNARQLNPMDADYAVKTADLLVQWSNAMGWSTEVVEKAIIAYKQGIENEPFDPFYRVKLATLLQKTGDRERAEGEYRRALELEPRYLGARVLLAELLASRGAVTEAMFHYRTALEMAEEKPPLPLSPYVISMIKINGKQVQKALEELEEVTGGFTPSADE